MRETKPGAIPTRVAEVARARSVARSASIMRCPTANLEAWAPISARIGSGGSRRTMLVHASIPESPSDSHAARIQGRTDGRRTSPCGDPGGFDCGIGWAPSQRLGAFPAPGTASSRRRWTAEAAMSPTSDVAVDR
jgi:hypothetical protein